VAHSRKKCLCTGGRISPGEEKAFVRHPKNEVTS
jgi:hypothetical protein